MSRDRIFQRQRILFALAAAALLAACSSNANKPHSAVSAPTAETVAQQIVVPDLQVGATEFAFDAPASVAAGRTHIQLHNTGMEDHQAELVRINDGVSQQQVGQALQKNPNSVAALVTFAGGPGTIAAGGDSDATLDLTAGHYLFLCFVPGRDGVPHVAKGMVRPIEVTDTPSANALAAGSDWPPAQATIALSDFTFDAPASLPAGKTSVQVVNNGPQVHEMSVVRLKGITGDQLRQIFSAPSGDPPSGPPPFEEIGGMNALAPGGAGQTTLNLTPGTYALVCHVPDPTTGQPHVSLGMLRTFTVQ